MTDSISSAYSEYDSFRPEKSLAPSHCYFQANLGTMIDKSGLAKDAAILEIGPGRGEVLDKLRAKGFSNLEAFDICDDYRVKLRDRGYRVHDGESLEQLLQSIPDGHYDLLLAMDVLEHIEKDHLMAFLKGFRKKLKTGGRIIGQVPNSSGLFGQNAYLGDITHVTAFNEVRLASMFRGCGYAHVEVSETKLPSSPANLVRTLARSVLFKIAFVMSRIVGAVPVRVLSPMIMFEVKVD